MSPIVPLFLLLFSCISKPPKADESYDNAKVERVKLHSAELRSYASSQNASTEICILVDMSLPSWKNRLFVVNLENDSVLVTGLCAHGRGEDDNIREVTFSNVPGSNCTSEGRYRIGTKYAGEYGFGYKLHGLDSTNNNAFKRCIVLHYYPLVPNEEDKGTCLSLGCPMVSKEVFEAAAKYIDASKKPVLLWIYK